MKRMMYIIAIVWVFLILLYTSEVLDGCCLYKLSFGKAKSYNIPKGYHLLRLKNKYTIENDNGRRLGVNWGEANPGGQGNKMMWVPDLVPLADIDFCVLYFKDSSRAKACAKKFFDSGDYIGY